MEEAMTHRQFAQGIPFVVALVSVVAMGCAPEVETESTGEPTTMYSVGLTATTPSALPKCTTALSGVGAHVDKPSSLWMCNACKWREITCTADNFGGVAYAESRLWVCRTDRTWTEATLPSGPPGTQGPAGPSGRNGAPALAKSTNEPAGAQCAAGGVRVEVGADIDADGALAAGEVTSTFYVCNGANGEASCNDRTYQDLKPHLAGCYLPALDLTNAVLPQVDLSSALLEGAILRGAELSGANLSGANLTDADLAGARLVGADLSNANLTRARLLTANLKDAVLTGAILTDVIWVGANCPNGMVTDTRACAP
jgi:hypothetical protein